MLRYVTKRLLWAVPMLFGISLLTFLLLDLVPIERAVATQGTVDAGAQQRAEAVHSLRVRYGMIDADSGQELGFWPRYTHWLGHALSRDFAPSGEPPEQFRERFWSAVLVSALLAMSAMLAALVLGLPLGAWLGRRAGSGVDHAVSTSLLALAAMPEFLIATLLVLFIGGGIATAILPASGLRTPGSSSWGVIAQALDLVRHLALPVATLSIAPTMVVARYVREAVARASREGFAEALRAWGTPEREVQRRVFRHALGPVWTLLGTLLPSLIAGAVVVEQVFAIPGFGRLSFQAVMERDVSVVMASVLFTAVLVLIGLLISDLLHRHNDPRVELR